MANFNEYFNCNFNFITKAFLLLPFSYINGKFQKYIKTITNHISPGCLNNFNKCKKNDNILIDNQVCS